MAKMRGKMFNLYKNHREKEIDIPVVQRERESWSTDLDAPSRHRRPHQPPLRLALPRPFILALGTNGSVRGEDGKRGRAFSLTHPHLPPRLLLLRSGGSGGLRFLLHSLLVGFARDARPLRRVRPPCDPITPLPRDGVPEMVWPGEVTV